MKRDVAMLGLLLTIAGILWQASAKLTRMETAIEQLQADNVQQGKWIMALVGRQLGD